MSLTEKRRMTAEEYDRLADGGFFGDGAKIELIRGEIVPMTPMGGRHQQALMLVGRVIAPECTRLGLISYMQLPISGADDSRPEPDLIITTVEAAEYAESVAPERVLLAVEVGDSSIASDRAVKIPLYAETGIAEVWLIDVARRRIEVYRRPLPGQAVYAERTILAETDRISALALPGADWEVASLLPSSGAR